MNELRQEYIEALRELSAVTSESLRKYWLVRIDSLIYSMGV